MVAPKLRFKEFDGDWVKKTLGEVVKFSNGKRIPLSESERQKRQGDYRYYGASSVIDYIDDYLFNGEYILIGEDGANIIARSSTLAFVVTGKFWVNNHAHIFQSKDGNNIFLATYLESLNFEKFNSGTAQPKLNLENLKKVPVADPSLQEQKKIATFLSAVDEKIAQLSQKLHLLGQYKQGMMQKLFSQQIRFKADDGSEFGELKIGKLGDMTSIQGGFAFKSTNFGKGITKVIRIGDIEKNINLNLFSGICSNEIPDTRYLISENAIVMALSGATFGKLGKVKQGSAYINQRVATFHVFEDSLNEFVYQIMLSQEFTTYIQSIPSASAQPNISNQDVINFDLKY